MHEEACVQLPCADTYDLWWRDWTLTKQAQNQLVTEQTKVELSMLNVTYCVRPQCQYVCQIIKIYTGMAKACITMNATCQNVSGHQIDLFNEINRFFFINVILYMVIPGYEKLSWRNSQPLHLVVHDTPGSR